MLKPRGENFRIGLLTPGLGLSLGLGTVWPRLQAFGLSLVL